MALSTLKQACQLSRLAGSFRPAIYLSSRGFAAEPAQEESENITLEVNPFKGHKVEPPGNVVETNKDELFEMYKTMFLMRRMELTADQLYKQKLARGFLHLADGQEGVPVGMEAALDFDDSVIQSYRDHCKPIPLMHPGIMADLPRVYTSTFAERRKKALSLCQQLLLAKSQSCSEQYHPVHPISLLMPASPMIAQSFWSQHHFKLAKQNYIGPTIS